MLRNYRFWNRLVDRLRAIAAILSRRPDGAIAAPAGRSATMTEELALYRAILADQTELICRYRADSTVEYVNPAYCRYFGIRPEDILHRSYQPVIYAADRAEVVQKVAALTCQNPQVVIENRVIAQGEIRWTRWTNRCLCDHANTVIGYQSVGLDITPLKQIEQQLRDSEQRYRTLIETIPQLVWVAEADGLHRTAVNQRWPEFTGKSLAAVIGRGWLSVVHPNDIPDLLANWELALANGDNFEAEYRLRRADGTYVWHLSKAEPTYDEQGQIARWYGTCTDISDRKQFEFEHQQSDLALQALNHTLESRITERTASLAAANQALKAEIAERNQITHELRASEERLRRAVVDAPFPIIIHAEDGRILQMSQAISEITGYGSDELATMADWTARAYGDRQMPILATINRLYELDQRVEEGHFVVHTRWGHDRIWLFSSAPLGRLTDGQRLVISMAADVTQQKQTEATLAARLRQQAVVTQLSQAALSGIEIQTLFGQATQLMVESLSVEYAKVLELQPDGRSLRLQAGTGWQAGTLGTTVSSDTASQAGYTLQAHQPVVVKDLDTETRFRGPPLLTQHGVVSGMSTLIPGHDGQPFGVLGAHSTQYRNFTQDDINFLQSVANLLATAIKRKRTETQLSELNQTLEDRVGDRTQALAAANEELRAFSYSVAHDLRAPLRAIQGFAQVLQVDYGTVLDEMGREYLKRMANSAEHLDHLIQDLLTYSQLGRAEIALRPVNAVSLWHQTLEQLAPEIQAQSAHITLPPAGPQVYAQRSILRQVFSNLLHNALKFVAPEVTPHIQIGYEVRSTPEELPSDRRIRFWIQDNGIGIAPRHRQRIFQPFERLHGVESYPGTGIGLSIVKRAMQRMGGEAGVESVKQQGSRFWIELRAVD